MNYFRATELPPLTLVLTPIPNPRIVPHSHRTWYRSHPTQPQKMTVVTKKAGGEQLRWEANVDSLDQYTISSDDSTPIETSGTRITLHLKGKHSLHISLLPHGNPRQEWLNFHRSFLSLSLRLLSVYSLSNPRRTPLCLLFALNPTPPVSFSSHSAPEKTNRTSTWTMWRSGRSLRNTVSSLHSPFSYAAS